MAYQQVTRDQEDKILTPTAPAIRAQRIAELRGDLEALRVQPMLRLALPGVLFAGAAVVIVLRSADAEPAAVWIVLALTLVAAGALGVLLIRRALQLGRATQLLTLHTEAIRLGLDESPGYRSSDADPSED